MSDVWLTKLLPGGAVSKPRACRTIVAVVLGMVVSAVADPPRQPPVARDLAAYRAQYPTHLTRHGPPPAVWQDQTPTAVPAGAKEVTYGSDGLKLKAWVSDLPAGGKARPAVVFCHGGFWFGTEDWDGTKPFRDAGFVVMTPMVRGEDGNPGDFSFYYSEVDDVIAAGRALAAMPGVDPSRVFVSGHSAGGALATLAVMRDGPFAMAAPIGAGLDMRSMVKAPGERNQSLVVFDPADAHEVEARSALLFTASLRVPIRLFQGDRDGTGRVQQQFVALAKHFGKDATVTVVPGDHFQSLPAAVPKIVALFQAFMPAGPKP